MVEDKHYPHEFFAESIRQRHAHTTAMSISPATTQAEIQHTASQSDVVIVVTVNAYLDQQQVDLVHSLLQSGRPIIGIAVYNPYDLLAFPELGAYLVTYEYSEPALTAAVRVLFGEIQPQGHLPVSLSGLYPRGHATFPAVDSKSSSEVQD